jgi:aryl-phospho-beta-D-glucosidase BglC (GH1 family)
VEFHGALSVQGNQIVNQYGQPFAVGGNSFFWSNTTWGAEPFYNEDVVNWLKSDWRSSIVRASMGVDESGGYLSDPTGNRDRVITLVDAAIDAGLYVLIDWHSHNAEPYEAEAIAFFEDMATLYGDIPNVIYEPYNEPLRPPGPIRSNRTRRP